jgi:hypothetical protein
MQDIADHVEFDSIHIEYTLVGACAIPAGSRPFLKWPSTPSEVLPRRAESKLPTGLCNAVCLQPRKILILRLFLAVEEFSGRRANCDPRQIDSITLLENAAAAFRLFSLAA